MTTRIPRGASQLKWRRQRQEKSRRRPTINLVALMDVFTILVFFFLVHSTEGDSDAHTNLVKLPESVANEAPRETPVVTITPDSILLQDQTVVAVGEALQSSRGTIEALRTALHAQPVPEAFDTVAREVTIMGDKKIPFELLDRVMRTCAEAGYGNISLSVLQRPTGAG